MALFPQNLLKVYNKIVYSCHKTLAFIATALLISGYLCSNSASEYSGMMHWKVMVYFILLAFAFGVVYSSEKTNVNVFEPDRDEVLSVNVTHHGYDYCS